MTTEQLKEYLGIVVDMEKNIFTLEQLKEKLLQNIGSLGIPKNIPAPMESEPHREETKASEIIFRVIVSILTGFIISFLFFEGNAIATTAISTALIFYVVFYIGHLKDELYAKKIREAKEVYASQLESYHKKCAEDKIRVEQELLEKKVLEDELVKISQMQAESKDKLSQIYSREIIFPKYQNMIMACSLYEYFARGAALR